MRLLLFLFAAFALTACPAIAGNAVPASGTFPAEITSPEKMDDHISGLYKRKFYDLAQREAEIFIQRYPDHPRAQVITEILIDCLCQQNLNDRAISLLRDFLSRHQTHRDWPLFSMQLGNLLFARENYAEAAESFAAAEAKSQDRNIVAHAAYNRACALLKINREDEARAIFMKLAAEPLKGDETRVASLIKGRLFTAQFKTAAGDYQAALKLYQEVLASEKADEATRSSVLHRAAQLAFEHLYDYRNAAIFAGRHYAEFPQAPERSAVRQIFLYSLYHDGQYEQFLKNAREYRQEFPDSKMSSLLVLCLRAAGELKQYEEQLLWIEALLQTPELPQVHRLEGEQKRIFALFHLGRNRDAYQKGADFLKNNPGERAGCRDVLNLLGYMAAQSGDHAAAAGHYEQLLPMLTDDPRAMSNAASQLAIARQNTGAWSKAADAWMQAANSAEPSMQAQMLIYAAVCAQYARDYNRTGQLAATVMERFPENADLYRQALELRYNSCLNLKQLDKAMQLALDAGDGKLADKRTGLWLYRAACVQMNLGRYEQSTHALEKALKQPDVDETLRAGIMDLLLQLLCYRKLPGDTMKYLPDALKILPAEKPSVANLAYLANATTTPAEMALQLWQRLISHPAVSVQDRINAKVKVASLKLQSTPAEAEAMLAGLENECKAESLPFPADAHALNAELSLHKKAYASAQFNAEHALAGQDISPESEARALWVMARCVYDSDHDLNRALHYATRIFVVSNRNPRYAPMALHLAAAIYREQGKVSLAAEIEEELKRDFPGWRPAQQ